VSVTFSDPRTGLLLALASPLFLIAAIGAVPQSKLQRELDFKRLAVIEAIAACAGTAIAVLLALLGVNAEALIAGALVTASISTGLLLLVAGATRPGWDVLASRDILRFGTPSALSSLLSTGTRNVDYVILGARMSPASVGLYWRAFQLGVDYQSKVSGIMLRIAFPVYSYAGDRASIAALRARMVRMHATLLFPALALLIATAPVLVPWFYGATWEAAVQPAQILAIAGMASVLNTGSGPLLMAVGRPGLLLLWNAAMLVIYATVVLVLAPHGLVAVCWGVAGLRCTEWIVLQGAVVSRLIGLRARDTLRDDVLPAGTASVALLAAAFLVCRTLDGVPLPAPLTLLAATFAGGLAYLGVLRAAFPGVVADLRLLFGRLQLGSRRTRRDVPGSSRAEPDAS
jgi:O-antigen/teichoic acid export membrane protein